MTTTRAKASRLVMAPRLLLCGAFADFEPAGVRAGLWRRRHRYLEHTVLEAGFGLVGGRALRHRDHTPEAAVAALAEIDSAALFFVLVLPLTFDADRMICDLDPHVVLRDAGEVGLDDELLVPLCDFDVGQPALCAPQHRPGQSQERAEPGAAEA